MEGIVKTRGQGSESLRVRSPQRTFRSSNCNELIRFPSFEAVGSSSIIILAQQCMRRLGGGTWAGFQLLQLCQPQSEWTH
jgi:hypothetical protein